MNGLELAKGYFEEYGKPMLAEKFPQMLPYLCAGLFGSGSECFGFDDEISRDHDFEPGFCLLLPGEDIIDRKSAFALERAYDKLPREYQGVRRSLIGPAGGARRGVIRTADFFRDRCGVPDGNPDLMQWLSIPEYALAETVNGEIFYDGYGEVSSIRKALSCYPEDVRLKKLAGHLLIMAQSGQYNYMRCLQHGESGAAQLAAAQFVKSGMSVVFLLNRVYQPFYKWAFRAMQKLPKLDLEAPLLEYLLTTDNSSQTADEKYRVIEGICADIIDELAEQGLTQAVCMDLEKHAYSVNDRITDGSVRNLHILAAV